LKNLVADVSGMVQGVGFRHFVEQTAIELGIDARADNMDDGTVHIVASGDEQRLLRLVELVRQGSRYSSVDHVHYVITDRCG